MTRPLHTIPTQHEIPTHLNVEDKVLYGLSARQVMYLTIGCATGYALWNRWPELTPVLRLLPAVACLVLATVVALVRPMGRNLEEWAFAALHYAALPRRCVWRPRHTDTQSVPSEGGHWADLAPRPAWTTVRRQAAKEGTP